jgi:hypothetical protein
MYLHRLDICHVWTSIRSTHLIIDFWLRKTARSGDDICVTIVKGNDVLAHIFKQTILLIERIWLRVTPNLGYVCKDIALSTGECKVMFGTLLNVNIIINLV